MHNKYQVVYNCHMLLGSGNGHVNPSLILVISSYNLLIVSNTIFYIIINSNKGILNER